jgi:hypothetical protein
MRGSTGTFRSSEPPQRAAGLPGGAATTSPSRSRNWFAHRTISRVPGSDGPACPLTPLHPPARGNRRSVPLVHPMAPPLRDPGKPFAHRTISHRRSKSSTERRRRFGGAGTPMTRPSRSSDTYCCRPRRYVPADRASRLHVPLKRVASAIPSGTTITSPRRGAEDGSLAEPFLTQGRSPRRRRQSVGALRHPRPPVRADEIGSRIECHAIAARTTQMCPPTARQDRAERYRCPDHANVPIDRPPGSSGTLSLSNPRNRANRSPARSSGTFSLSDPRNRGDRPDAGN